MLTIEKLKLQSHPVLKANSFFVTSINTITIGLVFKKNIAKQIESVSLRSLEVTMLMHGGDSICRRVSKGWRGSCSIEIPNKMWKGQF